MIKEACKVAAEPILTVLNRCIVERNFPRVLRSGIIKIIPKSGDKQPDDPKSYHPITLLPSLAHQDVFPRSYQYDLDCVKYRRQHACDGLKEEEVGKQKPLRPHCRDCRKWYQPSLTPFQLAWANDPGQKRWQNYPDLTATLTSEDIRTSMKEVGRPFQHEACNWYYETYPPVKYNTIIRKFSK